MPRILQKTTRCMRCSTRVSSYATQYYARTAYQRTLLIDQFTGEKPNIHQTKLVCSLFQEKNSKWQTTRQYLMVVKQISLSANKIFLWTRGNVVCEKGRVHYRKGERCCTVWRISVNLPGKAAGKAGHDNREVYWCLSVWV